MKVNNFECNMILLYVLLQCVSLQGAVITFEKQTPDDTNGNTCGVIKCQHLIQQDDHSVLEMDITSVGENALKLAMVFVESGKEVLADDIFLANKSFSGNVASVELRLSRPEVCMEDEFICEVTYVNQVEGETSEIAVVMPGASSLGCDESERCATLSRLTDYILSVNDTVRRLSQIWELTRLSESQMLSKEWTLVFRGTSSIRKSVYSAYVNGTGVPDDVTESGCKQVQFRLPCSSHYRNDQVLNSWHGISEVAFAIYKDNVRVGQVIFDAAGSTFLNWFDKARVKSSTWPDMLSASSNVFSIPGYQSDPFQRVFFMSQAYNGCGGDAGWFVALDSENGNCDWDQNEAFPVFKYSGLAGSAVWDSNNVKRADFVAVFVRYFNVP
ncbi:hypothetical protein Btru_077363 [Bulinus truncatus]|nr:hypothetical protein Btru_077363 [Bulinus truncatus]